LRSAGAVSRSPDEEGETVETTHGCVTDRRRSGRLSLLLLVVGVALALTAWPNPALADTINVSTTAQLQAAVANGAAGDTITLAAGGYAPSEPLEITRDMTIQGTTSAPGARIAGSAIAKDSALRGAHDVLVVHPGVTVTIRNVAVEIVEDDGAAIDVYGSLTLSDSQVSGSNGTGIWAAQGSKVAVDDTTISSNDVGLQADGGSSTTLLNVTLAANRFGISNGNGGRVDMTNTIVAGSGALGGSDCSYQIGSPTSPGSSTNSLDDDGTCGANIRANPSLSLLTNNGGPTLTRALRTGSPAIGAGSNCPPVDQRGAPRGAQCDIGAFAFGATPPGSVPTSGAGQQSGGQSGTSTLPAPSTGPTASGAASPGSGTKAPGKKIPATKSPTGLLRAGGSLGTGRTQVHFELRAAVGEHSGLVRFTDLAAGLHLYATSLSSVTINAKSHTATLRGVGRNTSTGKRTKFTLIVTGLRPGRLRISLADGYKRSGAVTSGSVFIA
jgi:hypothetical protein